MLVEELLELPVGTQVVGELQITKTVARRCRIHETRAPLHSMG